MAHQGPAGSIAFEAAAQDSVIPNHYTDDSSMWEPDSFKFMLMNCLGSVRKVCVKFHHFHIMYSPLRARGSANR